MPQVIVLALFGAGLYAGYRWLMRTTRDVLEMQRAAEEACQEATATGRVEKNLGMLEYDPATGVYRPVRKP
jgi:hypothetical protein